MKSIVYGSIFVFVMNLAVGNATPLEIHHLECASKEVFPNPASGFKNMAIVVSQVIGEQEIWVQSYGHEIMNRMLGRDAFVEY